MSISIGMAMNFMAQKSLANEEFDEIIKQHALWLEDDKKGKRADLSGYNLSEFDLAEINLSKAILEGSAFWKAKMTKINLSGALMRNCNILDSDLTEAVLDDIDCRGSHITHSNLTKVHATRAIFSNCVMWDNNYTEAVMTASDFTSAEVCDGKFTSANMSYCNFWMANLDYAHFDKANMKGAILAWTKDSYWATFKEADMQWVVFDGAPIADEAVVGAKNLFIPICCPAEGSFIAWTKSTDNKIVKLLIPEHAQRTGGTYDTCRASEVEILEIIDGDTAIIEGGTYHAGDIVKFDKYDGSLYYSGEGIYFRLSRADAEMIKDHEETKDSDTNEEE